MQTEERQPAEMVESNAHVDALEQARYERHLEPARLALPDERDQLVIRRAAEAEDDVTRARVGDHAAEVGGRAENGRLPVGNHVGGGRVGVEIADRLEAELRLRVEAPLHV